MDLVNKLSSWAEHNRFLVLMLILGAILGVGIIGCQPKTTSLLDPQEKVTPIQLEREVVIVQLGLDDQATQIEQLRQNYNARVAAANAQIEAAGADLQAQQELRLRLLELAGGLGTAVAQGGVTAPVAVGSIVQMLALLVAGGAGLDSIRKSKVIGTLKNGEPPNPA